MQYDLIAEDVAKVYPELELSRTMQAAFTELQAKGERFASR
ncbi:MAG: hypothetical protein ACYDBZ_12365 [Steroidobacteraceae bacterium]